MAEAWRDTPSSACRGARLARRPPRLRVALAVALVALCDLMAPSQRAARADTPQELQWLGRPAAVPATRARFSEEEASRLRADDTPGSAAGGAARRDATLLAAVRARDADQLRRLLARGVNPDVAHSETDTSPLLLAAQLGETALVRALLDYNASPNGRGAAGIDALGVAALHGHARIVDLLARAGAWIDARAGNGNTALHSAAALGHLEVVRVLLRHGADWSLYDRDGMPALGLAAVHGHAGVMQLLIDAGVPADSHDARYAPILAHAVRRRQRASVEVLLRNGVQPGTISVDVF